MSDTFYLRLIMGTDPLSRVTGYTNGSSVWAANNAGTIVATGTTPHFATVVYPVCGKPSHRDYV